MTSSGSGGSTTRCPARSGALSMGLASGCCTPIVYSVAFIGLAASCQRGPVAPALLVEQADLLGRPGGLFPDPLELVPQRRELGLDRGAPPLQLAAPAALLPLSHDRRGPLPGLLGQAHRAGEDALRADVDVPQLDAAIGEQEFADLVGVRHAAGLQDVHPAVALAPQLDVPEQDPGVDDRRDAEVGLLQARLP